MTDRQTLKPLVGVGSSRRDFRKMPAEVTSHMGYALYVAQLGGKHRDARPLKGFGSGGVVEVVRDHRGDTLRAVYTVRIAGSVYVLHAFQKKSTSGHKTSKAGMGPIFSRLRDSERIERGEA